MHEMLRTANAVERRRKRREEAAEAILEAEAAEAALRAELSAKRFSSGERKLPPRRRDELEKLERKLEAMRTTLDQARRGLSEAAEARVERLRGRGKLDWAECRPESDDSESDFSDSEEHRFEREDVTLTNGRCWVDLKARKLTFEGLRWSEEAVREERE